MSGEGNRSDCEGKMTHTVADRQWAGLVRELTSRDIEVDSHGQITRQCAAEIEALIKLRVGLTVEVRLVRLDNENTLIMRPVT